MWDAGAAGFVQKRDRPQFYKEYLLDAKAMDEIFKLWAQLANMVKKIKGKGGNTGRNNIGLETEEIMKEMSGVKQMDEEEDEDVDTNGPPDSEQQVDI